MDVVDPQATAGAEAEAVDGEEAVNYGSLVVKEVEFNDDDLLSVASLTSESSRSRPTNASSTSRDTSMSSASRTTFSSHDESADESWTTVGKPKAPKATNSFKLKLTAHGGLQHLESKITPRTPRASTRFAMLSIADDEKENASDGESGMLSPRTPRQRRR